MEKKAADTGLKNQAWQVCQNCIEYSRKTKKCRVTGNYVARKHSCGKYSSDK